MFLFSLTFLYVINVTHFLRIRISFCFLRLNLFLFSLMFLRHSIYYIIILKLKIMFSFFHRPQTKGGVMYSKSKRIFCMQGRISTKNFNRMRLYPHVVYLILVYLILRFYFVRVQPHSIKILCNVFNFCLCLHFLVQTQLLLHSSTDFDEIGLI